MSQFQCITVSANQYIITITEWLFQMYILHIYLLLTISQSNYLTVGMADQLAI